MSKDRKDMDPRRVWWKPTKAPTPDELMAKLDELQKLANNRRMQQSNRTAMWRKQLVPGTVPARSADELLERMGFAVAREP